LIVKKVKRKKLYRNTAKPLRQSVPLPPPRRQKQNRSFLPSKEFRKHRNNSGQKSFRFMRVFFATVR
jgi:hypothetical protein